MIDISDGLVADLDHVAVASGVRIELRAAEPPARPRARRAPAELLGVDPFDWVAGGGDDHCFAATVPADADPDVPWIGDGRRAGRRRGAGRSASPTAPRPPAGGHEHFRR